jgi:hypothetical protein
MSSRRRDGEAFLVTGSRGSGKTAWVMQQIPRSAELVVWDVVGEWSRRRVVKAVHTLRELHAAVVSNAPVRVGYVGPISTVDADGRRTPLFPIFCRLAWVWMRCQRGRVLVVEELADVTSPGKAPDAWGEIVRKGRHEGGSVYALTQRPAESDKTIAGNADVIHTGRLSFPRDRKSLAEYLDVPEAEVTALPSLHYIERDMRTRELRKGVVKFTR